MDFTPFHVAGNGPWAIPAQADTRVAARASAQARYLASCGALIAAALCPLVTFGTLQRPHPAVDRTTEPRHPARTDQVVTDGVRSVHRHFSPGGGSAAAFNSPGFRHGWRQDFSMGPARLGWGSLKAAQSSAAGLSKRRCHCGPVGITVWCSKPTAR